MMWIVRNWKLALLGMVTLLCLGLYASLGWVTAERDSAKHDLKEYRRLASEAMKVEVANNERANEELRKDIIPRMVESAQNNAYKNYLARFGRGNAACGIRADGLRDVRTGSSDPPNDGAKGTDEAERERVAVEGTGAGSDAPDLQGSRLFVESCARDAGRLDLWIKRCQMSPKLCKVEE